MSAVEQAVLVTNLEEPKASQTIVDLPCGYLDEAGVLHKEVELTEMTGHEEDLLASTMIAPGKKFGALLQRCVKRIGSYTDRGKVAQIVSELLIGDRVFLLFSVRRLSLGDIYPFKARCDSCDKEGGYSVHLGDLGIKQMPDPRKRIFDSKLPSGIVVRHKVLTGRDEEELAKITNTADRPSLALLSRMELLDGKPPTLADIKALRSRDRDALRALFDEVDGGVDTTLEMRCQFCGSEWSMDLELGQIGFFFPSKAQKTLRLRSSI